MTKPYLLNHSTPHLFIQSSTRSSLLAFSIFRFLTFSLSRFLTFSLSFSLALFLSLPSLFAQEQRFKASLQIGLNASQIDGDIDFGFHKLGLQSGINVATILSDKQQVSVGIHYSQRGSQPKLYGDFAPPNPFKINLQYIEVPILFHYQDWEVGEKEYYKFNFAGGLSYGRLFKSTTIDTPYDTINDKFRKNNICWIAQATFNTSPHVGWSVRYTRDLLIILNAKNVPGRNLNSLTGYFLTFAGNYTF